MAPPSEAPSVRIALVDDDSGLASLLVRRFAALRRERELLNYAPGPGQLAAMRLHALLVNPALGGIPSVDVFVRKLRNKLELVLPGWDYIHTHLGVGYRFAAEPGALPPEVTLVAPDPLGAPR